MIQFDNWMEDRIIQIPIKMYSYKEENKKMIPWRN